MKILYILVFSIIPNILFSQSIDADAVFCAAGNYKIDGYAQISWTLGDCQTKTFKSSNIILTQGFLQSRIIITGIQNPNNTDNSIQMKCFPNPVQNILQIEIAETINEKLILELYSSDGKIMQTKLIQPNDKHAEIDFSPYQHGMYILKATSQNKAEVQSFKILYQD
jgi:hypothetical protein